MVVDPSKRVISDSEKSAPWAVEQVDIMEGTRIYLLLTHALFNIKMFLHLFIFFQIGTSIPLEFLTNDILGDILLFLPKRQFIP